MKQTVSTAVAIFVLWCSHAAVGADPGFVQLSDHCYYLQSTESGENVAAVITNEGILLVNPPPDPELSSIVDALKSVSESTIRWVVFTEPSRARNADAPFFAGHKPLLLASARQRTLSSKLPAGPNDSTSLAGASWLVFDQQMRLFPSDLEVRIFAVQNQARSGGDIAVYLPAEKVLLTGALVEAARYPDIDTSLGGSAIGWLEGMKQVIDAIPVLKSAITRVKPDPKADKDKRPEENIIVLSSRGDPANLQNIKDLLEATVKLRSEIARTLKRGRTCGSFLTSSGAGPYRSYSNLDSFVLQLCTETQ